MLKKGEVAQHLDIILRKGHLFQYLYDPRTYATKQKQKQKITKNCFTLTYMIALFFGFNYLHENVIGSSSNHK